MTELSRRSVLAAVAGAGMFMSGKMKALANAEMPSVYQLRIYELFEQNKAAFHARFRDHALRIMALHGFNIIAMWEVLGEAGPEFVYLLRWPESGRVSSRTGVG